MTLSLADAYNLLKRELSCAVLHITSGDSLAMSFQASGLPESGDALLPFREAMCDGTAAGAPFSTEFQRTRAASLGISFDEYRTKVMGPLAPFLEAAYPAVALWFGADMFCIANLISLLARLDDARFGGQVFLIPVEERIPETAAPPVLLPAHGFRPIYDALLCRHEMPEALSEPFLTGARLYLDYHDPNGALNGYIRAHIGRNALLSHLLSRFPEYGLGDTQYQKRIDEIRHENGR